MAETILFSPMYRNNEGHYSRDFYMNSFGFGRVEEMYDSLAVAPHASPSFLGLITFHETAALEPIVIERTDENIATHLAERTGAQQLIEQELLQALRT